MKSKAALGDQLVGMNANMLVSVLTEGDLRMNSNFEQTPELIRVFVALFYLLACFYQLDLNPSGSM